MTDLIKNGEGIIDLPAIVDDHLIEMADKAEKRIDAVKKIKSLALKVTNRYDWTDQNGKPYMQVSGAEKVARLFGISWTIDEPRKQDFEAGHFMYTYKGLFSGFGVSIEAVGSRSSKDGFFKKYKYEKGKERTELPASEIDPGNVKKAAYTNCIGNGVSRLLGIRNLTWDEVEQYSGVKRGDVSKIEYKSPSKPNRSKSSPKTKSKPEIFDDQENGDAREENRKLEKDFPVEWAEARQEMGLAGGLETLTDTAIKLWNKKISSLVDKKDTE